MPLPDPELPTVGGILTPEQVVQSAASIAAVMDAEGAVPWPDGHTDAWDHVECAMALLVGGLRDDAERAYRWLADRQAPDGSWPTSFTSSEVLDATVDVNQCAYVAVGVWHHWLVTADRAHLERLWPTVTRALDLVVRMQTPRGEINWSIGADGEVRRAGLLTGSSSMYQALRCGIAAAEVLGDEQPDWELAAGRLQHAVAHHPEAFLDKDRWSMDWYYPVLGGAVRGEAGRSRIASRWEHFVVPGVGIRCVSDRPWVTGAETCELVVAVHTLGDTAAALRLFADMQHLRHEDGSYWTGLVYDEGVRWPGEQSTYTAAAVVLAADVLAGGPCRGLWHATALPTGVLIPGDGCDDADAACRVDVLGEPLRPAR